MLGIKTKVKQLVREIQDRLPDTVRDPKGILDPAELKRWNDDGYYIARGLFSADEIAAMNQYMDQLWDERRERGGDMAFDMYLYSPRHQRIYFRDAPDDARQFPYKLNDLFLESPEVRSMALAPKLAEIIRTLLGGDPMVFNSLNFEHGSQQKAHLDTLYMPPKVKNKMCAAWIALEDIHPDSGPLFYYPGSHKIPRYLFSTGKQNAVAEEMEKFHAYYDEEIAKRGMKTEEFCPRAGDVLIWHAQLLHGGSAIKDPARTRKSLVTHYFRQQEFPAYCSKEHGSHAYYFIREHGKV